MVEDPLVGPEVVGVLIASVELVGRPSLRSGSGQETLPEVRKWSEDPPGGLEVVEDPLVGPEVVGVLIASVELVGRPSLRSGSGQETLPEVQKWSRGPLGGPEVIGRPSRSSGSGRETLQEVRKWSDTIPEVCNWSGDPPKCPEVVGRPSRKSGNGL